MDALNGGGVRIAIVALSLSDERGSLGAHNFGVAGGVADVDQHFDVAHHVEVAAAKVGELHCAVAPVAVHSTQRHVRSHHKVFHVARIHAIAHGGVGESCFPIFTFPAVGGIGIHGEGFVAIADVDQCAEFLGAHGGRAGVNLVCQIDAKTLGVRADLGGLVDKPLVAFFDKIAAIRRGPESPRVTGG